jgi:hypothetical protein
MKRSKFCEERLVCAIRHAAASTVLFVHFHECFSEVASC